MFSNIRHHRISALPLLAYGALVGVVSAVVAAAVAMGLGPLFAENTDLWTFPKVVSSILLGTGAAEPLAGFEALPVLLGMGLHLALGAVFGAMFAFLIAYLDMEGTVPVILMGLIYGVAVFSFTYVGIASLAFPAFNELPLIVGFYNHAAFGLVAGIMLGDWAERWDTDAVDSERYGDEVSARRFRKHDNVA